MIEDGRELVAYDDGKGSVLVRTWAPDGTVSNAEAVLVGINPEALPDEASSPGWTLSADRRGTVVVVALGAAPYAGATYATLRDPDSGFRRAQQLAPAEPDSDTVIAKISAIAPDGTVTVTITQRPNDTITQTRAGRAAMFSPASAAAGDGTLPDLGAPSLATLSSSAMTAVTYANGSAPIRVGSGVLRLCRAEASGCGRPQLYTWRTGRAVIAFSTADRWRVAVQQPDGSFDHPTAATRDTLSVPVASPSPEIVDFTRSGVDAATGSRRGPLLLVPYGDVPTPRAPRVTINGYAPSRRGKLSITAHCRSTCRLSLSVTPLTGAGPPRRGTIVLRQFGGRTGLGSALEPLEFATLSTPAFTRTVTRLRAVLTAHDPAGRRSRLSTILRRGRVVHFIQAWCVVGAAPTAGTPGC